jgi:hypothetical protein
MKEKCPACGALSIARRQRSQWRTGRNIICSNCGAEFHLGLTARQLTVIPAAMLFACLALGLLIAVILTGMLPFGVAIQAGLLSSLVIVLAVYFVWWANRPLQRFELRESAIQAAQGLCCVCGRDFSQVLGGRGLRVLQVCHHGHQQGQPSASDAPVVVCANCHCLLHLDADTVLSVQQLREMLREEGFIGHAFPGTSPSDRD